MGYLNDGSCSTSEVCGATVTEKSKCYLSIPGVNGCYAIPTLGSAKATCTDGKWTATTHDNQDCSAPTVETITGNTGDCKKGSASSLSAFGASALAAAVA